MSRKGKDTSVLMLTLSNEMGEKLEEERQELLMDKKQHAIIYILTEYFKAKAEKEATA